MKRQLIPCAAIVAEICVYQFYDFWGMKLVPPSKGLMILIH